MKSALVIGAGPSGLAAAYELAARGNEVVVLEATDRVGGLSRTESHHGNRIDIGGHRFFSKSDRVMDWWASFLPIAREGNVPDSLDCLLERTRKSRIYWDGKLLGYPVSLNMDTIAKLGVPLLARCGFSYLRSSLFPRKERSLEDFYINRFGKELYRLFFRDYTEKVWGIPCSELSPDWGAQRVKGLSILKVVQHALRPKARDIRQANVETSLIGRFLYPPHGPGQLWEKVASEITRLGGSILFSHTVDGMETAGNRIRKVLSRDGEGSRHAFEPDMVFSSMPVRSLVQALGDAVPGRCRDLAAQLLYRDFFTVGVLLDRLSLTEKDGSPITDNWIYVHDSRVSMGRMQFFGNWSPYMVSDPDKHWIGLEYFCSDTDPVWHAPAEEVIAIAGRELEAMGIARAGDVLDGCRIHAPKAYPVYLGQAYEHFNQIMEGLDGIANLYPMGRNGMHRYNNMDHSMLTAFESVDSALGEGPDKALIWKVNAEKAYHEERGE